MTLSNLITERSMLLAVSSLASLVLVGTLYKYLRSSTIVQVKKLIIYPIKSLPGIEVDTVEITSTGLKYKIFHDRSFVLLNESNNFVTQRTKPKLSLIGISLHENEIWLSAPNMPVIKLDCLQYENEIDPTKVIDFKIWGGDTQGIEYSEEANRWFSEYLNASIRLIRFHKGLKQRNTSVQLEDSVGEDINSQIVYQDGSPYLLINNNSVADLNNRLARPDRVTYINFRPNILIENAAPFAEDSWAKFRIGEVCFKNVKPCTRCTLTTVMPEKGKKNAQLEPLRTLKAYRINENLKHLYKDSPLFGVNLVPITSGHIRSYDQLVNLDESIQ